jgi:TolB-like protein
MQTLKALRMLKFSAGLLALALAACAEVQKSLLIPPDPKLDGISCVVVFPFENRSSQPEAGKILSGILATEIYSSQRFNVMEWEEAQAVLQASGQALPNSLAAGTAQSLAQQLGVQAALIGTVSDYSYGSTLPKIRRGLPSVAFTASLIDAQTGKPLWASDLKVSSAEIIEPRRESVDYLAMKAARDTVESLAAGNFKPADPKKICGVIGGGAMGTKPVAPAAPAIAPAAPAAAPAGPQQPKTKLKIAVFNASGTADLEVNVAQIMLLKNWDVDTVAKYPYDKTFDSTVIYYRPDYEEEAKEIEAAIPGPQRMIPTDKMTANVNVTILVGKDQIGR